MDVKMIKKMKGLSSGKTFSQEEIIKSNIDEGEKNKNISDKTLLYKQKMKNKNEDNQNSNRILITINVFGSAGPIRFVVNGDDNTAAVIETALKQYGREGRLPILGSDNNSFSLYTASSEYDALKPWEAIGSRGARNFILCKIESKPQMSEARSRGVDRKGSGWRSWLQKSLSLKILSH